MVVHVGICAHRISRDLWLKDHHKRGMRRKYQSTYRGQGAAGGLVGKERQHGLGDEEFSLDQSLVRVCWSICPIGVKPAKPKCSSPRARNSSTGEMSHVVGNSLFSVRLSRSRSDQVVAGVAM